MKFIRYFLLILIVAAQVAYLVYSYGERTREIENAPHLVLKCKQYDPRDILRGDYFAISNSFLRLELDSPVWGKSLYWGKDFDQERVLSRHIYLNEGKAVLDITPREKGADDAVDLLNTLIDGGKLAVFWKQGEDGIHNATRVEAPGTAEDTAAEGEIRTVMNVEFAEFAPQRVETDEEGKDEASEAEDGEAEEGKENKEIHYTMTATFKFSGITNYDGLHFYIPDNMTPNDYEIPEDWKDKFSVVLVYREDGTVIPNMLCVDGQPYLNAVKSLPRREGRSRYNTSLYHGSHSGEEVVPVVVPDKEETAGEEKAEEQTEQPSEEVKPEEPQPEEPSEEVQPQPEVQPQVVEEPQQQEQPQPEVQPQQQEQPQPQAVEEPAPAPEAPAPEEDDEI